MYFLQSAASESRRIDGALSDSNCRQRALSAISHRYWPTTDVVGQSLPSKHFSAFRNVYANSKIESTHPPWACQSCLLKQTRQAADRQPLWLPWFLWRRSSLPGRPGAHKRRPYKCDHSTDVVGHWHKPSHRGGSQTLGHDRPNGFCGKAIRWRFRSSVHLP